MAGYCKYCGYQFTENTGVCPQCGNQVFGADAAPPYDGFNVQQPFQPTQDPQQGSFSTQPPAPPTHAPMQNNFYTQQPYQSTQDPYQSNFYTPYIQDPHINTVSLIGFIIACISIPLNYFGILGIAGIVGLVMSAIGLHQILKMHERGKGLAVAGIIIGSISVLFSIVVFIIMLIIFYSLGPL